jgi:hypothetical protein
MTEHRKLSLRELAASGLADKRVADLYREREAAIKAQNWTQVQEASAALMEAEAESERLENYLSRQISYPAILTLVQKRVRALRAWREAKHSSPIGPLHHAGMATAYDEEEKWLMEIMDADLHSVVVEDQK